jgi:hypothetical protein
MVTTPIITFISDPNEPDVYNDVNSLPNPFTMNIPAGIANTHPSATLYFKMSIVSPPADYSVSTQNLGSLLPGANGFFIFSPVRATPTLTAGEYDETLTFRVDAYTDSGYSAAYANQTLSLTVHHFDHLDASWTVLDHTSFDDGSMQGWDTNGFYADDSTGTQSPIIRTSTKFLSSPYSLQTLVGVLGKTFKIFNTSTYSRARVVIHVCESSYNYPQGVSSSAIRIDYAVKKPLAISLPHDQWCRLSYNLPIGASKEVAFGGSSGYQCEVFFDEISVIAK